MTAANPSAGALAVAGHADLAIGSMTIRGRLSPASAQGLASAVADVLSRQLAGRSRHIGAITVRMPASVIDRGGGIDRAALVQAIARAERDRDA